ncbi:MAG: FGGY-family carbohydrate kinase, partial [Bacteroidota bacterium]
GTGLHDSSAALIPHLLWEQEPFLLLSTGTWCIVLNPFNHAPLTKDQLQKDCLCYLQYTGVPVKASRFFGGHIHEQGITALSDRLSIPKNEVYEREEYRQLMQQLIDDQVKCIAHIEAESPLSTIIVDGGFSTNSLFMKLLSEAFPAKKIKASAIHQGTALGAAMVLKSA